MTESTTATTAPEAGAVPSPASPGAADTAHEARVFTWIRSLGFQRGHGWAGGICVAIADRIGIDATVVRGIAVVATVLGFPLLWIYALAWAVLPDDRGRIPLRMRAGSGPALLGAAGLVVLAVVHVTLGISAVEAFAWSSFPGRFVWELTEWALWLSVLGAIAVVIAWFARRRRPARADFPRQGDDGGVSGTAAVSGGATSGVAPPPSSASPVPAPAPEPPEPLSDLASAADLDAWRAQHAAWREQHDEWRRRQLEGDAVAAAEDRARREAERAAFRAEAARLRAERRATRPRTSIPFVAITFGTALIGATAVWLAFQPNAAERAWPAAVLTGAAVVALAMILAGVVRRRSGFLAFVAVVLLAIGGSGLAVHAVDDLVGPGRYVPLRQGDDTIAQPFGELSLEVASDARGSGVTRIEKGTGTVYIAVYPGVDVRFETTGEEGEVTVTRYGEEWAYLGEQRLTPRGGRFEWSRRDQPGSAVRTIVLDQPEVDVRIDVYEDGDE
ncbi:PspC domain-containing protein [Microbacterium sp. NPDC096154]|uniref:PspC domain-containing protein n=1 Tax=Microbacterium sp. NPDC096154 TaxID=3155549 RepID=UPI003322AB7A